MISKHLSKKSVFLLHQDYSAGKIVWRFRQIGYNYWNNKL